VLEVHHETKGTLKVNRQWLKPYIHGDFKKKKHSIKLTMSKENQNKSCYYICLVASRLIIHDIDFVYTKHIYF
jgi:hypothetical protein